MSSCSLPLNTRLINGLAFNQPEVIRNVLSLIPESERINYLCHAVENTDRLHRILTEQTWQETFNSIFELIPLADRVKIIHVTNSVGLNLYRYSLGMYGKKFLKIFAEIPPSDEKMKVFDARSSAYGSLHYVVSNCSKKVVCGLLRSIIPSRHNDMMTKRSPSGKTVLHYAAIRGDADILDTILAPIPKDRLFEIISLVDKLGSTVLHTAISQGYDQIATEVLLNYMTDPEIDTILGMTDKMGLTVVDYAVTGGTPIFLNAILHKISEPLRRKIAEKIEQFVSKNIDAPMRSLEDLGSIIQSEVSRLTPNFKVISTRVDAGEKLYLLGKTDKLLEEFHKLIGLYTAKVAPEAPLRPIKIKEVENSLCKKYGYYYYTSIEKHLPPFVREVYGVKSHMWRHGEANCHGSALLCAGFDSQITHVGDRDSLYYRLREKAEEIPITELTVGDYVLLDACRIVEPFSERISGNHSFIYFNHEFCLSMNGAKQPLEFYTTTYVLVDYGFPPNALEMLQRGEECEWAKSVHVFRKRSNEASSSS